MGMDATISATVRLEHHVYKDILTEGMYENTVREDSVEYQTVAKATGLADLINRTECDITIEVPVAYFRKNYDLHRIIGDLIDDDVKAEWNTYYGATRLTRSDLEQIRSRVMQEMRTETLVPTSREMAAVVAADLAKQHHALTVLSEILSRTELQEFYYHAG
jgi:predicted DsbA family dithiol-disulfide isomerase